MENVYLLALERGIIKIAIKNKWGLNDITNWILANVSGSVITSEEVAKRILCKIEKMDTREFKLSFKLDGKIVKVFHFGLDESLIYAKYLAKKHCKTVRVYETGEKKPIKTVRSNGQV